MVGPVSWCALIIPQHYNTDAVIPRGAFLINFLKIQFKNIIIILFFSPNNFINVSPKYNFSFIGSYRLIISFKFFHLKKI